ncbi:uncharacterized protein MKK02DRAFT_44328 [Dioszegia hungarica]|uniref:Uncharacterized protein n=1 Tax=Dioszegia hungarica TaxID=4972 RepID=A0AA38H8F3_9TREE|nr:uncharacterized protein MKK02DRAFT_44328 [Dioszegia hungarica]KAI9635630.1 hypothetical protein MKK02DRAFT_44328 [Dioszegia hungarica]
MSPLDPAAARSSSTPISLGLHRQLFTTRPNPLAQPSAPPPPAPPPTQPDNITTPPSIDTTTPLLSPHTSPKISSTRLQAYAPRLTAISRRTGVPFASLAGSFLVLHEITAIVPVVILFFIFQALGAGAGIVAWLTSLEEGVEGTVKEMWEEGGAGGQAVKKSRGWKGWVKDWMAEAEEKAERVGKRYGILGYEKVVKPKKGEVAGSAAAGTAGASGGEAVAGAVTAGGAAEKVANAIAAYVVVKVSCLLAQRRYFPSESASPSPSHPLLPASHSTQSAV